MTHVIDRKTATVSVATYPANHPRHPSLRQPIQRHSTGWEWSPGKCSSSHAAAVEHAQDEGAVITRERITTEVRYSRGPKELRDLLKF